MELFPAQPDLSLQISPPNAKPTSTWRRSTEEDMDLGFWKRALDSRNSISSMAKQDSCVALSLSNPKTSSDNSNSSNLIHHFQNASTNATTNPFQPFHHNHYFHQPLFQPQHQSLSQDLGFLRPIRGIPVYQNPPPIPFTQHHHHHHHLPLEPSTTTPSSIISTTNTSSTPFHSQALMRSRFLSRFPAKRSMRAPRMRWTSTLHARFVHAVELLGGHESMLHFFFPSFCLIFFLHPFWKLIQQHKMETKTWFSELIILFY